MAKLLDSLKNYHLILASKSPRRHELLKGLGLDFEIRIKNVDESFPQVLSREEIPEFLAKKKADAFADELGEKDILITSDTVVVLGDKIFNKPENRGEAISMINELSGRSHEVITGVCLTSKKNQVIFHDRAKVFFGDLDEDEISDYIDEHKPYDKAGSYGIQEWIGYAAIERIEGSFYTVMGFPTRKFYTELKKFTAQ
ncbi:MAG: Maf family nucleotide pyrophosphatase [Cryomorphaceae bacterium]|nr:Maf family nucleotide pyrophosphatase [Flavobacteriales bacterium]